MARENYKQKLENVIQEADARQATFVLERDALLLEVAELRIKAAELKRLKAYVDVAVKILSKIGKSFDSSRVEEEVDGDGFIIYTGKEEE